MCEAFIIVCVGSSGTTERRAGRTGMVNKYEGERKYYFAYCRKDL